MPVPPVLRRNPRRIAAERKWVVAVYLITVFIALTALVIILVGVLKTGVRVNSSSEFTTAPGHS